MLNLSLAEIALWTHGTLAGAADVAVHGVAIDSRRVVAGDLFVALAGEHVDGHDFLAAAAARGAAAALVTRAVASELPCVRVADSVLALGDLASAVRAGQRAQVVGITGSNGKTTVKTLTAAVLAQQGATHLNQGNYNNEIGVPLTVLAMPDTAAYAVIEMGAGKPGDIDYLAAIARPQIGLVNNIAPAHLERMGNLDTIAETKGALYQALPADGVAVINADDAYAGYFANLAGNRRVLRFGLTAAADVQAQHIQLEATASRFELVTPLGACAVHLPLGGRHNVANALAAAAVGVALALPVEAIRAGLAAVSAVPGRLQARSMTGGWTLIDDSYNANPGSLKAAVDTLALTTGERWLVLGDMAELGPGAGDLHADIGAYAKAAGIERLWTMGRLSARASDAFGANAAHFDTHVALAEALGKALHGGVTCLVKGSRSSAMERVIQALPGATKGDTHAA
ncbi:MAG TPA: UDP-N-acetylmuramoyl-tripeptide--D-alanyl-D-alanine ligase [Rhodanobacteraceae bacterium]|nr:UDP-N-acetylmuramoyl-tripeptide--D-alanyl-D-alanine ligase [Rhodanobacteraceae bacterium]